MSSLSELIASGPKRIAQGRSRPKFRLPRIRRLRDITPRGLYWRSLLIIILPIALMQIAVTYAFFDSHWRQVSRKLSEGVAGDIAFLAAMYERDPANFSEIAATARETTRLSVAIRNDERLPTAERRSIFSVLDRTLQLELSEALTASFWFDTTRYPDYIDIRVETGDGGVLRALAYRDRAFATTGHIFVLWIALATALLTLVAVLFIRNQVRPIEKLAQAADAYGRGVDPPDFKPSGAREVRLAARSVVRMRNRIQRFADQRTAMLAGVSHDLRTPLTRLKLELALLKDADTEAAKADIAEMEAMLDGYLNFARGDESEPAEITDLAELASTAAAAARDRADVAISAEGLKPIKIRPLAIKRAVSNLVNNAADHADSVRISVRQTPEDTSIIIEDDGPGIDEDRYAEAFRPFGRLDAARNQNVSGVGLGLSIARDAARAHGRRCPSSALGHGRPQSNPLPAATR